MAAEEGFGKIGYSSECSNCNENVEEPGEQCLHCKADFVDSPLRKVPKFIRMAPRRRDVGWVVSIHGMNSVGAWQEDFSWIISKRIGRSIPVSSYKYGNRKLAPVFRALQRRQICKFAKALRQRIDEAKAIGISPRPDIVAHSFGTFITSSVLRDNPDLKVGRIILAGSIVHPDFDWNCLLKRGQVEAVLCHMAEKDRWVPLAKYLIPGSGPSGKIGFDSKSEVLHMTSPDMGHSEFFNPQTLAGFWSKEWASFLCDCEPEKRFDQR